MVWVYKIQILGGAFFALTIFEYLYRENRRNEKIKKLKESSKVIREQIKILKLSEMDKETFQVKEILKDHVRKNDEFETEVRAELKSINTKITEEIRAVIKVLTDYIIANDNRVGDLEGNQKATKKEIAIYVGLIGTFIMLVINTYMSFK